MTVINADPIWITTPEALAELGQGLTEVDWVAIDTESNNRFVYRERVCLLQISSPLGIHLIDPLAWPCAPEALAPLAASIANPNQTLYLHGGEYDVACLKRDYHLAPAGVFDSQQAASFLGFQRTGYGALVSAICEVDLPKDHSQYDWGQRPIDDQALAYAIDDVRYLPAVCQTLQQQVVDADLVEEVAIGNQAVMNTDAHNPDFDPQGIYRLKGVGKLSDKQLGLLSVIYAWRDEMARAANLPAGRIVANDPLLALARSAPTNFGQLKRMRLHRRFVERYADKLLNLIKEHRHNPPKPVEPPARRIPEPVEKDREQRLKAWRRQEAERREVPTQVVLPARALEHLKKHGSDDLSIVPQLGDKRIARYGDMLRKLSR